jgi:hypothetical protein
MRSVAKADRLEAGGFNPIGGKLIGLAFTFTPKEFRPKFSAIIVSGR